MKRLLPYLREYRKECIIAPLLKCMEALVDLFVPLMIADLIDRGINGSDKSVILSVGLYLLLLAAAGLALAMIAQWFSAKAAVGFATKVRIALFKHIGDLSFSSADQIGNATLITRLTGDINQVQSGINMSLRLLLRSPFIVFGALIMAYRVDPYSAGIFLITIPLLALVVYGVMLLTVPRYRKVQGKLDGILRIVRENLAGARVIRAFNLQQKETDSFLEGTDAHTREAIRTGRISALTNPLTYVIVNLAATLLIYVGAIRVDNGILTTGQVVALLNYMAQILVELVKLANLIVTITKALASAGRVGTVLETVSDMTYPADDGPEVEHAGVSFRDVTVQYAGSGAPSLSHISFDARPGETVGIIGGIGSGKSSLVNLIPRFYDPSGGTVLVGGHDVKAYGRDRLRCRVGVVPQKATLFSGTIRSNLLFGAGPREEVSDEDLWKALETAQAASFVSQKPGGLDEAVEQNGRNFSGGQKQRLTIARALVRKPSILILDDSASALDFATDAALRAALAHLDFHPTTFIVSQRISSIMHADRILVLNEGELSGIGTHEELLASDPVYQEIYHTQFREEKDHA
ncbi:MAG: ABC transporter ATP-binding protein [Lachnospiraceae bacterium]|nr:ABC transporter ATP-binding protein [Lachnospiraceae bacterium]